MQNMSKENYTEDNGGDLRQLILLQQRQQKKKNFSLLAISLGDILNTSGNSCKQYLQTMTINTSRSPVSEGPDLGNRQNMLSEDAIGNILAKGNVHFESDSSSDAKNNTRTNEPEDPNDKNRPNNKHLRLRAKRKVSGSDNDHSSTSSTKESRHTSSSSEDTEDDDDDDDDRLSVKVKHKEYADPPLEDPLQTLNKVVTKGNDEQP